MTTQYKYRLLDSAEDGNGIVFEDDKLSKVFGFITNSETMHEEPYGHGRVLQIVEFDPTETDQSKAYKPIWTLVKM